MEHGNVVDWEGMEKVWEHTFKQELKVDPSHYPVLLSVGSLTSRSDQERIAKIMFGTFRVPYLYIAPDAALSLYATGRTTGVVLLAQDDLTQVVSVHEGEVILSSVMILEIGGKDIGDYFERLLGETEYFFSSDDEKKSLRDVIEKFGYVAFDYDNEMMKSKNKSSGIETKYRLPTGKEIIFGNERFRAPEILFRPSTMGLSQALGIHQMIFQSIMRCPEQIRQELFANIVLSDENTMFSGFKERITKEISKLAPAGMKVNVIAPTERNDLTWIGGSRLGSHHDFKVKMMSIEDYENRGRSFKLKFPNFI